MRILIVEDDPAIAANLYDYLEARGHRVASVRDGNQGFALATKESFDALLLDLNLPGMDGLQLCQKLREEAHVETPILMLTARDTLEDKLTGFAKGADDYVVKPFALQEIEVRLRALEKRRVVKTVSGPLRVGDLTYDPNAMTVSLAGVLIKLPPKCLCLLELLISSPGRVCTRKEIELHLWGQRQETSDRLRYHMHLLRRSLLDMGGRDPIETVHGRGFRLLPED